MQRELLHPTQEVPFHIFYLIEHFSSGFFFVLPERHANVHEFCIATENIPRCVKLQKNHITVCYRGLPRHKHTPQCW